MKFDKPWEAMKYMYENQDAVLIDCVGFKHRYNDGFFQYFDDDGCKIWVDTDVFMKDMPMTLKEPEKVIKTMKREAWLNLETGELYRRREGFWEENVRY